MEDSLFNGDIIIVNKLKFGPRLPRSPNDIPWIKILFIHKKRNNIWKYKRLTGTSDIKSGDILVFNHPKNNGKHLIKRCIGLPNNKMQIQNGKIILNGKLCDDNEKIKHLYSVYDSKGEVSKTNFDAHPLEFTDSMIKINLSKQQFIDLKNTCYFDSIIKINIPNGKGSQVFPWHSKIKWSIDNFGPIQVPAKGMMINLSEINKIFYRYILTQYEGLEHDKSNNFFTMNGKIVYTHKFKQNYYFTLGDNRHYSNDSRNWGFVPEECIIGKAVLIVFPSDINELERNRFLKKIK